MLFLLRFIGYERKNLYIDKFFVHIIIILYKNNKFEKNKIIISAMEIWLNEIDNFSLPVTQDT